MLELSERRADAVEKNTIRDAIYWRQEQDLQSRLQAQLVDSAQFSQALLNNFYGSYNQAFNYGPSTGRQLDLFK